MVLAEALAIVMMTQSPIVVTGESGVGYEALMAGETAVAIAEIEANTKLEADDPVRLINLGLAYAHQGQVRKARVLFEEAMRGEDRMNLETSRGEWKDSRHLARHALKLLESGNLGSERLAVR